MEISEIKVKATKLMNAHKNAVLAKEIEFSSKTLDERLEDQLSSMFVETKEQADMMEFFNSFREELHASKWSEPSEFLSPRGFTHEYRNLMDAKL